MGDWLFLEKRLPKKLEKLIERPAVGRGSCVTSEADLCCFRIANGGQASSHRAAQMAGETL